MLGKKVLRARRKGKMHFANGETASSSYRSFISHSPEQVTMSKPQDQAFVSRLSSSFFGSCTLRLIAHPIERTRLIQQVQNELVRVHLFMFMISLTADWEVRKAHRFFFRCCRRNLCFRGNPYPTFRRLFMEGNFRFLQGLRFFRFSTDVSAGVGVVSQQEVQ